MIIELLKTSDKEEILKANRRKKIYHIWKTKKMETADFFSK